MSTQLDTAVALLELQAELLFKQTLNLRERSFWITGEINDKTLKHVEACLGLLESENSKAITIRINSGGGECYPAAAIISRLRSSNCTIKTEGHGHVMSAACAILACGRKRSIAETCSFMFHESGYGVDGRHSEVKAWVEQFEREQLIMAKQMARFSSQPAEFWVEAGKHTDKFFSPSELIEMGVVDKVLKE